MSAGSRRRNLSLDKDALQWVIEKNGWISRSQRRLSGGWPTLSSLLSDPSTTEAAPPFALFEGWAPRTSTLSETGQMGRLSVTSFLSPSDKTPICVEAPATLLRRWLSSFHHHQQLSAQGVAGPAFTPRPVSSHPGRDAPALRFRRGRIRGHARVLSSRP